MRLIAASIALALVGTIIVGTKEPRYASACSFERYPAGHELIDYIIQNDELIVVGEIISVGSERVVPGGYEAPTFTIRIAQALTGVPTSREITMDVRKPVCGFGASMAVGEYVMLSLDRVPRTLGGDADHDFVWRMSFFGGKILLAGDRAVNQDTYPPFDADIGSKGDVLREVGQRFNIPEEEIEKLIAAQSVSEDGTDWTPALVLFGVFSLLFTASIIVRRRTATYAIHKRNG